MPDPEVNQGGSAADFISLHLPANEHNVVLTPHMGAYTEDTLINMAAGAAENLCAFFEGREPPHVVV